MGVSGISREVWEDTEEMTGYSITPVGVGMDFEIRDIREGIDRSNDEYLMVDCVYYDDGGKQFHQWEYFSFASNRIGFLKTFLLKTGRADLMHEDADWGDLIDTTFRADCVHRTYKGELKANLKYESIIAVSHDCTELEVTDDEPTEEDGGKEKSVGRQDNRKKNSKPAPRRSPRARSAARA